MATEDRSADVTQSRPEAVSVDVASSVRGMVGRLTERTVQVHSNGPLLQEIVREEVRPLIKQWLDQNLPELVERLVQAELERVSNRTG